MSDVVTLTLRGAVDRHVEVEGLTADRIASLTAREIAALPAWVGSRPARVGDLFDVRGESSARVRIEGALGAVSGIGAGMRAGELVVDGDAGHRVGAGMSGGSITVTGRVGDDAGVAMGGGTLCVHGAAGDRLGSVEPGAARGMTGGEIVVRGSAGRDAAGRMRRGLVVVGGDVAASAARSMIAGTLVVFGGAAGEVGRGSKRGSVIAVGPAEVPGTYRYACTYEPPYVQLLMSYLVRRHGLSIDRQLHEGRYRRYCGDGGGPGKGEILLYDGAFPRLRS